MNFYQDSEIDTDSFVRLGGREKVYPAGGAKVTLFTGQKVEDKTSDLRQIAEWNGQKDVNLPYRSWETSTSFSTQQRSPYAVPVPLAGTDGSQF